MILCVGATPAIQRVMIFRKLLRDGVNRASQTLEAPSGKVGNVAKVVKSLGGTPEICTFLGGRRGTFFAGAMSAAGIPVHVISGVGETRQCLTVIDEADATQTELIEESSPVDQGCYARLLAELEIHLPRASALILSGSLTPGANPDFFAQCVRLAKKHGVFTTVDAQGESLRLAVSAGADLLKPNRAELAATVSRELASEAEVIAAARGLVDRGAKGVIVTAGSGAVLGIDADGVWRVAPPVISVRNAIGSGDAFAAAATMRLSAGANLAEALQWGAAAGAANALTEMPGELSPETFRDLLPQCEPQD